MIYVKAGGVGIGSSASMDEWQPVATAPFDRELELAVINKDGEHALIFACRRILGGWVNAATRQRVEVYPTHWREWHPPNRAANS